MLNTKSEIVFDFWACQRPLTRTWGSGQVYERIVKQFGTPDVVFGKTDNIPEGVFAVDKKNGYEWKSLPFKNNHFAFAYWDPPYYKINKDGTTSKTPYLYKHEGVEIWRTTRRIAILHNFVFPRAWLKDAEREAIVAVTMGPLKQIRCLQIFHKRLSPAATSGGVSEPPAEHSRCPRPEGRPARDAGQGGSVDRNHVEGA